MPIKTLKLFFIVEKIGPYHNARFNYLAKEKGLLIHVIETNPLSTTYLWDQKLNINYKVYKLDRSCKECSYSTKISNQINQFLFSNKPDIIFVTGWYDSTHHYLIYKSHNKRIPLILLSDSRYKDEKRILLKETIKKILLNSFSSAIVAGKESRDYLLRLKFKNENIFSPINVVDNNFFYKSNYKEKLPYSNYFLCIARFVTKKNHESLIKAFEIYKNNNGKFNLLIIGSGPKEEIIKRLINKSKFKNSIFIDSWKQINELPKYYKNAKAIILPSLTDQWGLVINEAMACGKPCIVSKNCGCYLDLIEESKTGWGFDPKNIKELACLLNKFETISYKELNKLENNIKIKIRKYDLDSFSDAVNKAIYKASQNKKFSLISSIIAYLIFKIKKKE